MREPYSYWAAVYRLAWAGEHSWLNRWIETNTFQWSLSAQRAGILRSFPHFIIWVEGQVDLVAGTPGLTQSSRIAASCGPSCSPDYVLHSERVDDDWAAMLEHYQLPRVALPHLHDRASHAGESRESYSSAPVAELTPEVIATINRIDAPMFVDFGYEMMDAPQVASVAASRLVSVKAELVGALGGTVAVLFLMVVTLLILLARTGYYCERGDGGGGGGDGGDGGNGGGGGGSSRCGALRCWRALWRWWATCLRGDDHGGAVAVRDCARVSVTMSPLRQSRGSRGSRRLSSVEECDHAPERAPEPAGERDGRDEWAQH